jgi:type IV secretory pathway component VirB8
MSKNQQPEQKKEHVPVRPVEFSWETSRLDMIKKSESKAWLFARVAGGIVILETIAICLMCPLKTVEPFVIETNKETGLSQIVEIANPKKIPVSEVMNKYWVAKYVVSRESYDWYALRQDYDVTRELSMPDVFQGYARQFDGSKNSLDQQLGDSWRYVVNIKSIVLNSDSLATVRFTRKKISKRNEASTERGWTATISFEYHPTFIVSDERRLINPFGFKVVTYRLDPELK